MSNVHVSHLSFLLIVQVKIALQSQRKMELVQAFNCVQRLLEEEALIIKEMVHCLEFVREHNC